MWGVFNYQICAGASYCPDERCGSLVYEVSIIGPLGFTSCVPRNYPDRYLILHDTALRISNDYEICYDFRKPPGG